MSNFSPEYLKGWKDSVEAEQISGDRASLMTFGLIGGFILGIIALWWGGPRGRSFKAEDLEVIDPDADAKKAEREAAALAELERTAESGLPGNLNPAPDPKPSDLERQAG